MTKAHKKQPRHEARHEKSPTAPRARSTRVARIKEFSKRFLHDYVIPMTRSIEHRLLRLEQSL